MSFVQDRMTWHDMSQGGIQQTGNPLDVAIEGNAFLVVQTPRGERYTRNGALQINAQGQLVTSAGDQVLGDAGRSCSARPTATSSSIPTARSACARARATPTPAAAGCGSSRSPTRSGCKRTARARSRAPDGMQPQAPAVGVRIRRARSRNPTCARWSR